MQRSPDEVDDILYGQMNQIIQYRPMQQQSSNHRHHRSPYVKVLRTQNSNHGYSNGVNRSLSSSRTVDAYYDNLMTRSSDNYE